MRQAGDRNVKGSTKGRIQTCKSYGTSPLALARKSRGLTQAAVAERVGAHVKMVSFWECGKVIPSDYYIARLCRVLRLRRAEAYRMAAETYRTGPAQKPGALHRLDKLTT